MGQEAMSAADSGIEVIISCVSYLTWNEVGSARLGFPKAAEDDNPQSETRSVQSKAAVVCLQAAAMTSGCFVLAVVMMQFSRSQQRCASMPDQEAPPASEAVDQTVEEGDDDSY